MAEETPGRKVITAESIYLNEGRKTGQQKFEEYQRRLREENARVAEHEARVAAGGVVTDEQAAEFVHEYVENVEFFGKTEILAAKFFLRHDAPLPNEAMRKLIVKNIGQGLGRCIFLKAAPTQGQLAGDLFDAQQQVRYLADQLKQRDAEKPELSTPEK